MSEYFTWDISREIFTIYGPMALRWYSLLFITGLLVGNYIFIQMAKKEGKNPDFCEPLLYYIVIGTVVGARLGHCLFYDPAYYLSNPLRILKVWEGGLASHGGYIGVIFASYLFARKYRHLDFWWIADRVAIVSLLGGAFIRLGNFFNSEIIGKITDVPWAIIFAKVDGYPRHPTQLYESLGYFLISMSMLIFYKVSKFKNLRGRLLGITMVIAFSFRAFIEQYKENQEDFENAMLFNMGQYLSFPAVLLGLFLAFGLHERISKRESLKKKIAN